MKNRIYNVSQMLPDGNVEMIQRKYRSLYRQFSESLPMQKQLVNAYIRTNDHDGIPTISPIVTRYPKTMNTQQMSVFKPTAKKDLDSSDAKYGSFDISYYDILLNNIKLFSEIEFNLAEGNEKFDIPLGSGVVLSCTYQLKLDPKKLLSDLLDRYAYTESQRALYSKGVFELYATLNEIAEDFADISYDITKLKIQKTPTRWGFTYKFCIGVASWDISQSITEELTSSHPLLKIETLKGDE